MLNRYPNHNASTTASTTFSLSYPSYSCGIMGRKKGTTHTAESPAASTTPVTTTTVTPIRTTDTNERITVKWKDHMEWTDRMVAVFHERPEFRRRLFSDSTAVARQEDRAATTSNGMAKKEMYAQLAEIIFNCVEEPIERRAIYMLHKAKFVQSVEGRLTS
jgi:hypothetical protein